MAPRGASPPRAIPAPFATVRLAERSGSGELASELSLDAVACGFESVSQSLPFDAEGAAAWACSSKPLARQQDFLQDSVA
jgi:hypothetical protein